MAGLQARPGIIGFPSRGSGRIETLAREIPHCEKPTWQSFGLLGRS